MRTEVEGLGGRGERGRGGRRRREGRKERERKRYAEVRRGGAFVVMHVRSCTPASTTVPGRRTSGVHRPGRLCLRQARRAIRWSTRRVKCGLYRTKNDL